MHMILMFALLMFSLALPSAAKTLTVAAVVYAVLQAAKQSPWFSPWLKSWWAVALNVVLTVLGVVFAPPGISADQLFTLATLQQILITVFLSAGFHGTVSGARCSCLRSGGNTAPLAQKSPQKA